MTMEFWIGGAVAAAILVYLFYVLLNPENF